MLERESGGPNYGVRAVVVGPSMELTPPLVGEVRSTVQSYLDVGEWALGKCPFCRVKDATTDDGTCGAPICRLIRECALNEDDASGPMPVYQLYRILIGEIGPGTKIPIMGALRSCLGRFTTIESNLVNAVFSTTLGDLCGCGKGAYVTTCVKVFCRDCFGTTLKEIDSERSDLQLPGGGEP